MKKVSPFNRIKKDSGIILLVVLWILMIVSVLAIGLGRRTGIDLSLTRFSLGKLRADYIARAGIIYGIHQLQRDTQDEETSRFDSLYQCGVALKEKTQEELFKDVALGEGKFDLWTSTGYGLQDEERKININALTRENYGILKQLILLLGYEEDAAETVAASVVDWTDIDSVVTNSPFGAETLDYERLEPSYRCKNAPFDSVEELLLVNGVTEEIFSALKDYVTVFPKESKPLYINVNTASPVVLQALTRAMTGAVTNTEIQDADSLVAKIINYRAGPDGEEATGDDRLVDLNELGLNAKERAVFLSSKSRMTDVSKYFRIKVRAVDSASSLASEIEAVIRREDSAILYWHRE